MDLRVVRESVDKDGGGVELTHPAFSIFFPTSDGICKCAYLRYLRKYRRWGGSEVLSVAEEIVQDRGVHCLSLQDASKIACSENNGSSFADLTFLQLLRHGQTWYERHGYICSNKRARETARRGLLELRLPGGMARLQEVVRRQCELLTAYNYVLVSSDLHDADPDIIREHDVLSDSLRREDPRTSRDAVVRDRKQLYKMFSTTKIDDVTSVNDWLTAQPCQVYAKFMRLMYGPNRMFDTGRHLRTTAVASVHGLCTPTLDAFKRANAVSRFRGRIRFVKTFTEPGYFLARSTTKDARPGIAKKSKSPVPGSTWKHRGGGKQMGRGERREERGERREEST